MKLKSLTMAATVAVAALSMAGAAHARDQIQVVGSSTVFPFSQTAAEKYANETGSTAPVVESTGTGGGMKLFCSGVGTGYPDVTGASRAMKLSEYELCTKNGVTDVTEALIGFDGLSMAVSRNGVQLDLTKAQLFQALAAKVEVGGKIVDNPFKKWSDIDPSLPDIAISVMGPPPTSGTRDAWVELVMDEGCKAFSAFEVFDKDALKENCQRMRTDGPFIEAGENDNLIVQRLVSDPTTYGIFGYSFLYENQDKLVPVKINGVAPEEDTIANGAYGISRPLFFYVKNAHRGVIPGLNEFIAEYVSDDALSPGGYLEEHGLIPLSPERRVAVQKAVTESTKMKAPTK